jgi:hypothetical protein
MWAIAALAACAAEFDPDEVGTEAAAVTTGLWTRQSSTGCADQCGAPTCSCVSDRCTGNPEGQTCSPIGDECNVIAGSSYRTLQCVAPPPPPPPPPTGVQPGVWYRIASGQSGLCLGVASSSLGNGAAVVQQICGSGTHQEWQVEDPFFLASRIVNRNSGKCLDVANNLLVQNPCDGRSSQHLHPNSGTRLLMDIRSTTSNDCIEVPDSNGTIGLQIQTATCVSPTCSPIWVFGLHEAAKQLWLFLPGS